MNNNVSPGSINELLWDMHAKKPTYGEGYDNDAHEYFIKHMP